MLLGTLSTTQLEKRNSEEGMKSRQMIKDYMLQAERAEPVWVCQDCLGDDMLKRLQGGLMEEQVCNVCGSSTKHALTPERIARFIGKYLPKHFCIDPGLYPGYELTLEKVVRLSIGCESEIVSRAIAGHLEDPQATDEDFYCPGQEYSRVPSPFESEEHEHWYVMGEWHGIALELVHGRRFFNERARRFFESLIHEALGAQNAERQGIAAVATVVAAGTSFYRARIATGPDQVRAFAANAAVELGAPPKDRAANNRMSASGIPLLYVSADPATCIAEIRPSIGDTLALGRFESLAPLKFFDFTALSRRLRHAPISLFDPSYEERSLHRKLLEYLHEEIARPVRSNDNDYVMTQALAEFIRYNDAAKFDGISFRSVQRDGGINFVLFDKGDAASMVAPDWRPTFDLGIAAQDVTSHQITGVTYNHHPTPDRK